MVKVNKLFAILLSLVICFSIIGISAQALSYPSVFFYSDSSFENLIVSDTVQLGTNYPIRMKWYPAFNNEGYDISIYDNNGEVVASASKTWTNSGYTKELIVYWDTSGCQLGSYKIIVTKQFYSYYKWNEAPTTSTLRITLKCDHSLTVIDEEVEATCTESGLSEGKHCKICNMVLTPQEVIPAKGHTEVIDKAVAATYTKEGKTKGSHCKICGEIIEEQEEIPKLEVKKIALNKKKATLKVGKTLQLKATLKPKHSTSKKVKLKWSSSDKKVATVTKKGKVKAVGVGKATITVVAPSGKKATCKITVKKK